MIGLVLVPARACPWSFFGSVLIGVGILGVSFGVAYSLPRGFPDGHDVLKSSYDAGGGRGRMRDSFRSPFLHLATPAGSGWIFS